MFDFAAFADLIAEKVAARLAASLADDVLDVEQAAALMKLHPNTVREMAAAGTIPAHRYGKFWRFRRSALLEHVTPLTPYALPNAAD